MSKDSVIPCTSCGYCHEHCPLGIEIANCISIYNEYMRAGEKWNRESVYDSIPPGKKAGDCTSCGKCVKHCTQDVDIPKALKTVAESF
jgi:hypothetical protein